MNTLERITDYIKDRKVSWQLTYLQSLDIILQNKDKINSELLDEACKNIQNLIYEEQTNNLFRTESVFEELLIYNAFVYYVEHSLNKSKTQYHFMLFPAMTEDSGVSEIYYQEKDRKHVFIMELRESTISDRKDMFIVLCHELAHYVGSDIRCRSQRLDKLYNIYSRLTILGLKTLFARIQLNEETGKIVDFENEAWSQVEQNLSQWIKLYYERETSEDFVEEIGIHADNVNNEEPVIYSANNREHMFFIPSTMKDSIRDMLKYKSTTIFEPIITHCFENLGYDKREQIIQDCTEAILIDTHPENSIFSFSSAFPYIEYLLKESYADLISILELELTPFQYLHCLVSQYPLEKPERYGVKVCARIALVVYTMCYDNDLSTGHMWDDGELIKILCTDTEESRILNAVYEFIYNTIPESYFENAEAINELYDNVYMVLFDKVILKEIFDYLLTCRTKFYKFKARSLGKVRAFFSGENYERYLQKYEDELKELVRE